MIQCSTKTAGTGLNVPMFLYRGERERGES